MPSPSAPLLRASHRLSALRNSSRKIRESAIASSFEQTALPIYYGGYKLKKTWPPDFSKLSPQEQLGFEKKYHRRMVIATRTPRWNKFIGVLQVVGISGIVVWSVLFMEAPPEQGANPFQGFRDAFWEFVGFPGIGKAPERPRVQR